MLLVFFTEISSLGVFKPIGWKGGGTLAQQAEEGIGGQCARRRPGETQGVRRGSQGGRNGRCRFRVRATQDRTPEA